MIPGYVNSVAIVTGIPSAEITAVYERHREFDEETALCRSLLDHGYYCVSVFGNSKPAIIQHSIYRSITGKKLELNSRRTVKQVQQELPVGRYICVTNHGIIAIIGGSVVAGISVTGNTRITQIWFRSFDER